MEHFPTEILIYIFDYLSPKESTKCRAVCIRWKHIIDSLLNNEVIWKKECQKDFSEICQIAYYRRMPGLNWFHIYKCLNLWSKLDNATEWMDEFASATCSMDEIQNFQVLRDGIIGVQIRASIKYYDLTTLKETNRLSILGTYLRYSENDDIIVVQGYNLSLYVIRKELSNIKNEPDITFDNVKSYLLVDHDLFYVSLNDEVFYCNLNEMVLVGELLNQTDSSIMSVGYKNGYINILTFRRDIYTIVGRELRFNYSLDSTSNLLHELKKFNFLENLDWRVYFQWMFVLQHTIPQGPLRDIIIIKTYGDAVFVGSNWGVFRIYYAPYTNGEFDLFNNEPIKQFNFMERDDCPVLSTCPIIQIEVIESEDSHMILIAMPKKIAILSYNHSFDKAAAKALLPYKRFRNPSPKIITFN